MAATERMSSLVTEFCHPATFKADQQSGRPATRFISFLLYNVCL